MQVPRRAVPLLSTLAGIVLVAALASCSRLTQSVSPAAESPAPSRAQSLAPTKAVAITSLTGSKLIDGQKGGEIQVGRWWVFVPPGAYSGTGTITISVPDTTIAQCDLHIAPESLNSFKVPVALRYRCMSASDANQRDIEWWNPATATWVVIPSWVNTLTNVRWAALQHFSTYRTGRAGW